MWIRMGSFDDGVFVQAVVAAYCEDLYDGPCVDGVDDMDDVDGEGRMEGGRECEASDPEQSPCSDLNGEAAGQSGEGSRECEALGRRRSNYALSYYSSRTIFESSMGKLISGGQSRLGSDHSV